MAWKNMSYKRAFGKLSKLYPEFYPPNTGGAVVEELSHRVQSFYNIPQMMPKVPVMGTLIEAVRTDSRKIMLRVKNFSDTTYGNTTLLFVVYEIVIMKIDSTTVYENSNYRFTVQYNKDTDTDFYEQTKVGMSVMFDDEQELLCIIPLCEYRGRFSVIPYERVRSEAYVTPNSDFNNIAHQAYLAMGDIQEFDEDPYSIGGTSTIGGGEGNLDITSDTIPIPDLPVQSAVGSGFVQVYAPTSTQLGSLASFLWSTSFLESLVKLKNDPFDIIVSLSLMPFPIPVDSEPKNLKAGNVDTLIAMNVASSQFVDVDCGTFTVQPFYDAYLDFDPFTKCELFLPYHGVQELSLDDIMGKTIGIKYRVDILTGSYICYVTLDGSVFYTFTGTCGLEIPITGQDYSALYSSLINLATSAAVAGVAGAPVMAGGGEAAAAARVGYLSGQGANAISTGISALTMKPTISRSGSLSANIGSLGPQIPYLIFKVPRVSLPKNSMKITGYPFNATAKLSDLNGYTQIQDVKFSGMTCTERELSEIDSLLKAGIYIESNTITPVTDAHTVTLYTNGSHPSVINKSLTLIDSVTGEFRENQQLSDVQLTLNRSSFTGTIPNYIYIYDLHRYYFVEDVTIINSELIAMTCHVDLLQSFATEILQQTAVISKQENNWNLYLNDGTFKCYQNPYVIQKVFPSGFNTAAMTYVLTVTGGGE